MSEPIVLWEPEASDRASANVTRFLTWLNEEHGLEFDDYDALWRWSVAELERFWQSVWGFYALGEAGPYAGVLSSREMPGARWFEGAHLNYAEQILLRAHPEHPALLSLDEEGPVRTMSVSTLRGQVGALAEALRETGVQPGDRVAAYLPNIPEAVVGLLAVSSLGAVWTACAPDFGTQSVIDRFAQVEPRVLIAVDGYRFGGHEHDRVDTVAEVQRALPSLEATILVRRLRPLDPPPEILDARAFDGLVAEPREPTFLPVPFGHPLWILYSSGTTGQPKGIVQSHGGIVIEHLKSLGLCLDLRGGDRFFFFASTSWMAWNYLVGGLLHGATAVLYNGSPGFPTADRTWRVAAETRATVLGLGSAYVSGSEGAHVALADVGSLDALRTVIPTGSPLPPNGWRWLHEQLGPRTRIDSICGGTDVCTAFFGGSPLLPVRLGEISCRWLGVHAEAVNERGEALIGEVGEFVVRKPMPSMPVGFWNDSDGTRLRASYFDVFPGLWRQGDYISIRPSGGVVVHGRSDATLNRGGVRLGSAEMYGVLGGVPEIADSLILGVELSNGGYYMPLFVVMADGIELTDELRQRVARELRTQLSPRHVPDEIVQIPAVPRTLTGKKLEVPLKRILQGTPAAQAVSAGSVDHPEVIAWFEHFAHGREDLG
jgi:acetoacetyl-CoA synthetase